MGRGQNQTPPALTGDAARLAEVVAGLEQRTLRLYGRWSTPLRQRGYEEIAEVLQRFAGEATELRADCLSRLRRTEAADRLGKRHAPLAESGQLSIPSTEIDELDGQIASPYQTLAAAVRNEEEAFRTLSHLSAGTLDPAARGLAEALARLQLTRAARLRRHRRAAYRAERGMAETPQLPNPALVANEADLIFAACKIEAAAVESLTVAATAQIDLRRSLARTQQSLQVLREKERSAGTPRAELVTAFQAYTGMFRNGGATPADLLAGALADSKRGFVFYDAVVAGAGDEATMLLAQSLSESALRRLRALASLINNPCLSG